jgi:hypothetical protein
MPERDESRPPILRPVELHRPHDDGDPTASLRDALATLDSKLHATDGLEGIAEWLRQAERLIAATSLERIEATRRDIRELIDELLELNAKIQNIARLKHLLS